VAWDTWLYFSRWFEGQVGPQIFWQKRSHRHLGPQWRQYKYRRHISIVSVPDI
jgi:hypothetical protein